MNHDMLRWILLIVGAVATGGSVVAILVVKRSMEVPAAIGGAIGFGFSIYAFAVIAADYGRADAILWAFGFMLAAMGGGYALASTLLHRFEHEPGPVIIPPELPPPLSTAAVILVACIEPDSYDPRATAGMLRELSDEGLLDASVAALPFVFFAQKTRYRVVGDTSPAEGELERISDRLSTVLDTKRARVTWATCSGLESLPSAVARAVVAGHRRIVIAELTVAEPQHLIRAKSEVAALRLESQGVDVCYTAALFDSERVLCSLANRIVNTGSSVAHLGVVLVGHGQPSERARVNPSFDEQETSFLNRLRMLLLERGVGEHHVRVAWTDWGNPDVTSAVRHLAAVGCRRVLVLPAAYPLDTLATRLDLEIAVRQARVEEGVTAVTMPAWKDDESVIAELTDRIVEQLNVAGQAQA